MLPIICIHGNGLKVWRYHSDTVRTIYDGTELGQFRSDNIDINPYLKYSGLQMRRLYPSIACQTAHMRISLKGFTVTSNERYGVSWKHNTGKSTVYSAAC